MKLLKQLFLTCILLAAFSARGATNVVVTANDTGAGSLRQTIVNSSSGDTIIFTNTLSGSTILLTNGQLLLDKNLTIDAAALGITISGGNATRIFSVNSGQTVSLRSLTLTGGNGSGGNGGAINSAGILTLTSCTLFGNTGGNEGGAIIHFGGTLTLTNCTLSGNSAVYSGAIANAGGPATLTYCTLSGNSSTAGGGAIDNYNSSPLTLTACILAGNTDTSGTAPDLWMEDGLLTAVNCIIGDGLNSTLTNGVNANQVGTTGLPINPLLGVLANNGGPTPTMLPMPVSPAINAGGATSLTTDQRGLPRVVGPATDIGAVEFQDASPVVVNNFNSGIGSLRYASTYCPTGSTITFTNTLSGATILLTSGQLLLNKNLTIDGSTLPSGIQINGNATSRVFYVTNSVVAVLKSLTIANGLAPAGDFAPNGGGGGIFSRGRVDLLNCSVLSNAVVASGSSFAGGIACDHGDVRLTNCTVAFNKVLGGSGVAGAFYNFGGTLIFNQCTVASNQAAFYNGGVASGGDTTLRATVLANGNTDFFNEGGGASLGNNLIADGSSSGVVNGVNGDQVGTSGSPLNALLAPLGNYGGMTPTMPPLPGSPAIDAGGATSLTTDQRGFPRVVGPFPDIGAVELSTSPVILNTADSGYGSLRYAATYMSNNATITFPPALAGATITLASEIVLSHNVTIDATSLSGGITVSGGNVARILTVNSGRTVSLLGLTLIGGNGAGATVSGNGGAILTFPSSILNLTRCTLSGNISPNANGGALLNTGAATLSQCTLSDNRSTFQSGAIQNQGTLTMTNCTLANNRCGSWGGAILNFSGTATLTHCTLSGNSAGQYGGGIMIFGGTARLTNCIVGGNTAPSGGADIWNNGATLIRGGANIIPFLNSAGGFTDVGPAAITANPLLAPLGNYGGPTQTMPPLPGSPAFDAASVIAGLTTDQRGSARNIGAAPDIGAVESGGLWVQNNSNSGANSLRDVITNSASIMNSKTILFTTNLSGATIILASQIVLSNNVAIDASALANGIQISGNNATRVFQVSGGGVVALNGLRIVNGQSSGGAYGGAIFVTESQLSLNNCTLSGNRVLGGTAGGAIATAGGSTLNLTCCTLYSNRTDTFGGGAIFNQNCLLTLNSCTFSENFAADYGGAVQNSFSSTSIVRNCSIAANSAGSAGGGFDDLGYLSLENSIIASNSAPANPNIYGTIEVLAGNNFTDGNPMLALLGNYGGPTLTCPPLPGSPVINAASVTSSLNDQRGYPRPVGVAADIGAVEGIYNAAGPGKITSITKLGNGSVRLSFTNLTNASFPVVATTNLSQSLSNWTVVGYATETSAGTGLIQFTDSQAPNRPQRFYRVKSP